MYKAKIALLPFSRKAFLSLGRGEGPPLEKVYAGLGWNRRKKCSLGSFTKNSPHIYFQQLLFLNQLRLFLETSVFLHLLNSDLTQATHSFSPPQQKTPSVTQASLLRSPLLTPPWSSLRDRHIIRSAHGSLPQLHATLAVHTRSPSDYTLASSPKGSHALPTPQVPQLNTPSDKLAPSDTFFPLNLSLPQFPVHVLVCSIYVQYMLVSFNYAGH